jgi:hypothetical protein
MKILVSVTRILVGVLFIFSGLVKAIDPLGLGYKMQEFFEAWNDGLRHSSFFLSPMLVQLFNFLHEHSLALSVIMIAFEIIAGAALLLAWQMRLFSRLLLLLIIFFTFLTGYALLSGKFKNCGCFGDCLPITPATSFLKDVVLTLLIFFLFWQRKKITSFFSPRTDWIMMGLVIIFSFGIQWYMLTYLPVIDCLPFKKGNNISEQMKMPANAVPPVIVTQFVYEKDGKRVEFSADSFPDDFNADSYKFISRSDKIIRPGKNNEPPIKGFSLITGENEDRTQEILNSADYTIMAFTFGIPEVHPSWENEFRQLLETAKRKNIAVYFVTNAYENIAKWAATTGVMNDITLFKCDYTVIKTAARTNPCFYLVKQGTIEGKWSYKKLRSVTQTITKLP